MSLITKVIAALKEESDPKFADWYDHLHQHDRSSFEIELEQTMLKIVIQQMARRKQRWPAKGEKIIAAKNEIKHHWFTNVIANAKKLEVGQSYTVKKCDPASSWCPVEIEEIEGTFCLSCFDWKY